MEQDSSQKMGNIISSDDKFLCIKCNMVKFLVIETEKEMNESVIEVKETRIMM